MFVLIYSHGRHAGRRFGTSNDRDHAIRLAKRFGCNIHTTTFGVLSATPITYA